MTGGLARFETLVEEHHDEILSYLWRIIHASGAAGQAIDPADLCQETFMRAFRAYARLHPESNVRAWLYRIATNCAHTALARSAREQQRSRPLLDMDSDPAPAPEAEASAAAQSEWLRGVLAILPPKQQSALILRYLQGLDYAEIAGILGCSEESARANVSHGLKRLRLLAQPEEVTAW